MDRFDARRFKIAKKEGEKQPFFIITFIISFAAMKLEEAIKIMEQSRRTYDEIAADFSQTRSYVWESKAFGECTQDGEKVLDLGCGNGKLAELFQEKPIKYVGCDNSEELLKIARQKYPDREFVLTDGIKMPFADNEFDRIFCLAVLHHIPGGELREKFLREIFRVLKKGGSLVISSWRLWPNRKHAPLFLKYFFKKLLGLSPLDWGDVFKTWGKNGQRYFHNFTKSGLKKILKENGFSVDRLAVFSRPGGEKNLFAIAKK